MTDWRLRGICLNVHDTFFPVSSNACAAAADAAEAKQICGNCPVITECRQWALDHRIEYGVWGGLSERERRTIWRRQARDKTASEKEVA
ncbi:WhiB family transcriptional regulator [Streptomyces cinnamoneus]|uniref:WhiB family transcriptional regulator n=1 Tax=Streptomyces cinnamoneus TaxID=53446 RepID=UPI00340102F0